MADIIQITIEEDGTGEVVNLEVAEVGMRGPEGPQGIQGVGGSTSSLSTDVGQSLTTGGDQGIYYNDDPGDIAGLFSAC